MFKLATGKLHGQLTQSSVSESDLANLDDVYDSTTDHFTGQSVITGSTQPLTVNGTLVKNFYYWWYCLLSLSLSFPVGGTGHRPDLLQEAP